MTGVNESVGMRRTMVIGVGEDILSSTQQLGSCRSCFEIVEQIDSVRFERVFKFLPSAEGL